jgi:hypothetical protein
VPLVSSGGWGLPPRHLFSDMLNNALVRVVYSEISRGVGSPANPLTPEERIASRCPTVGQGGLGDPLERTRY